MLLRGGLDGQTSPAKSLADRESDPTPTSAHDLAEWNGFTQRIGWQLCDAEPSEDFEDQLAARISCLSEGARTDVTFEPGSEPPVQAQFGGIDATRSRPRWQRVGVVAAMMAVAAAALLAFAVSSQRAKQAASSPEPTQDEVDHATKAPSLERSSLPVDASTSKRPPELTPPERKNALPPKRDESKPEPPGGLVAKDHSRGVVVASYRPTRPTPPGTALVEREATASAVDARAAREPIEDPPSHPVARLARAILPMAEAASSMPVIAMRSSSSGQQHPVALALAENASWALSPANERWVGMSVSPTPAAGTAPAGIGVVAQVDLGRAFKNL